MSDGTEDPRKAQAASLLRRLVDLYDASATLENWNESFAEVVASVASRLRPKFGGHLMTSRIESAAEAAVRTVFRLVPDPTDRAKSRLEATGQDALIGLLVLIAIDKVYENRRRDVVDPPPVSSALKQEDLDQEQLVDKAIHDEIDRQLAIMLERLRLLGGGQEALVYILLLGKELGVMDVDYQDIPELTGVSTYSVDKARAVSAEYLPSLLAEAQLAVKNLARRLRCED